MEKFAKLLFGVESVKSIVNNMFSFTVKTDFASVRCSKNRTRYGIGLRHEGKHSLGVGYLDNHV